VQITRTTTTSPNGSYVFADLPSGIYTITETQLSPWTDGLDKAGTSGGSVGNDVLADITLPLDTIATGYLFGERTVVAAVTTTLSGFVYVDRGADGRTANGTKDTGEPGVLGVTLILRDSNGVEVSRTTTLADGSYSFPGITPGTYTVEEAQPLNYGSSTPNILSTLTVPPTGLTNVNFGETLGAISGTVYSDVNNNGQQDPGEPGIAGVRITVTGRDRENNPVNRFADTLADGSYLITDLLASDATGYIVTETQPTGWFDGSDASSVHGTVGNDVVTNVVLAPGEQTPVGRFGELAPVAVGDRVWDDLNGNGIQDSGEPGIDGVNVTLNGIDDRGNTVTRTTTTSSSAGSAGGWFIDQLRPGTYRVTFTKAGMVPTATTVAAGTAATDSDPASNGTTAPFTLTANVNLTSTAADNRDIDGGLYTPISLGDYVWRDDNLDGLQDSGEPPLDNVTVTLRHAGPDGLFDTVDDRTTLTSTAADGSYSFTNLAPGNVRVIIAKPTGYTRSPRGDAATDPTGGGTNANRDSNTDRATGSADVTLVSGRNRADVDGGLIALGSLGGIVWNDGTGAGDGQRNAGERGEPGITVRLLLPDGSPALDDNGQPITTVTAADGSYLFADIIARSYIVVVDVPSGYVVTKRAVGDPASDSDIDIKTYRTNVIVVAPLANVRHVDAGILNPVEPSIVPPNSTTTTTSTASTLAPPTTKRPNVTISDRPVAIGEGSVTTIASALTSKPTPTTTSTPSTTSTTTVKHRRGSIRGQKSERTDATGGVTVGGRRLALTGTDVLGLLGLAVLLTMVGVFLTWTTRRRSARKS
jgi:hypothetical protein